MVIIKLLIKVNLNQNQFELVDHLKALASFIQQERKKKKETCYTFA